MHTFVVNEAPITEYVRTNLTRRRDQDQKLWAEDHKTLTGRLAAQSQQIGLTTQSPLFDAFSYAFNTHTPLRITPDSIWLTILTGLVHHIDTDPEKMRPHFVDFEGKKTLEVAVNALDPFSMLPPQWEASFGQFAEQIQDFIGDKHDLIVSDFSTTTMTDLTASRIALMGAMKNYFQYKMMFCCEMPTVTVEGSPEDWDKISDRVRAFDELGLGFWTEHLSPVITQMRESCAGNPDIDFWQYAYFSHRKGSGGQYNVSGWVNTFYPYICGKPSNMPNFGPGTAAMKLNPFLDWEGQKVGGAHGTGNDPGDFPQGLVTAPMEATRTTDGMQWDCTLYGGLVGVSMDDDFTVRPESGWAVTVAE